MPNKFDASAAEDAARDRATEAWREPWFIAKLVTDMNGTWANQSAYDRALIEAINMSDGFDGDHLP
jgi:hypothetical protein